MSEPTARIVEAPFAASLMAGVARRDITPPVGIYARSWGAAKHDVAEGIHRPLTATVLTMGAVGGGDPLVLAVLDAGWWQVSEDEWFVRGGLIDAMGLDASRVMVSCTHTHAGPSLNRADADKPGGKLIDPYLESVRNSLIDATREALAGMAPASVTWAYGRCGLAMNRDLTDRDSERMLCGYNPWGEADDTLLVGRVSDQGGKIIATLVNYACHATTLAWENRLISPDYVGAMREVIEEQTKDVPCLFLQGASGELAPREQYTGDVTIADANGRQLGFAVLSTLDSMLPPRTSLEYTGVVESGAPLATWQRGSFEPSDEVLAERIDVELPLKPLPSEEEIQKELEECRDRTMAERLQRQLRVVRTVGNGPTYRMPIWIWRIGQSVLIGQPNEAYSVWQQVLRDRFSDYAVVAMDLVNGACGYLYPSRLADENIYQVCQSPFDRDALGALAKASIDEIERMIGAGRTGE